MTDKNIILFWRNASLIVVIAVVLSSCSSAVRQRGDGGKRAFASAADSSIGLSHHVRYLRWKADTSIVATRHSGWTMDSVRTYERADYMTRAQRVVYRFSAAERDTISSGADFRKSVAWMTIESGGGEITFMATSRFGDGESERHCVLYLSNGDFSDSVKVIQSGMLIGGPTFSWGKELEAWMERRDKWDPIDLCPVSMSCPASGGTMEATTKGTTWYVSKIETGVGGSPEAYSEYTTTQEERAKRVASQSCRMTFGWVTVENKGREVRISAAPNATGKARRFRVILACEVSGEHGPVMYSETFDGCQAAK